MLTAVCVLCKAIIHGFPVDNVLLLFYTAYMVIRSDGFSKWLTGLRDDRARARIYARIRRLTTGNPGDVKPVGDGVSEMRIDYGPGYRVYYKDMGNDMLVLLYGGDKSTQQTDIDKAKLVAVQFEEEVTP